MTLNPNDFTEEVLTGLATADDFSEALDTMLIWGGWHVDPGTGDRLLITEKTVALNQYGDLIRRDEIENEYERPRTPPLRHTRTTYARPYLPGTNPGRREMEVETEVVKFHPWSQFQQGFPNLSRKRTLSAWVVYDLTKRGEALTAEQRQELTDKGINPDGNPEIVVDSARLWSEANRQAEVVESASAPQLTKWVDPVETEFEIVWEEPDKYTIRSYRKNHLRPQDMSVSGPTYQRKPSFTYELPVDIEPPKIEGQTQADEGIRLTVTGGGAVVLDTRVQPERYRILRKTISEPAPAADPDPLELWDTPPAADSSSTMWVDSSVTDLSGTPASPLPSATPYTEPGDVSEPTGDEWRLVAEIDNEHPKEPEGFATVIDTEVENAGVYEYVATAIIGTEESTTSSPARVSYGGASRSSRMTASVRRAADGSLEIDVLAPGDDQYGETLVFDLPIELFEEEAAAFGEDIARRHFADDLDPGLEVDLSVGSPLVILERGQIIETPLLEWTTSGNDLIIKSETEIREWTLDGFRTTATNNAAGELAIDGTTLYLTEL